MDSYIHPLADVQTEKVGANSRIWQFVVVLPNAEIGSNANICSHCFIENDVVIGDDVTIKNGVQLWDGLRIGNRVFIGPNATFSNDHFPRSRVTPSKFLNTYLEDDVSIGSGAVILPGISIGKNAMIGAGAVVTRSVPPNSIVVGNPASIIGYTDAKKSSVSAGVTGESESRIVNTSVSSVNVHSLPEHTDVRGSLSVGEFTRNVPFSPKRFFLVYDVPSKDTRGEHAHHECHQFLICIKGSCSLVVDDGKRREEILLSGPNKGVHIPPMVWGIQYNYSADAMLLVFASEFYDTNDYIRNYSEFLRLSMDIHN